MKKPRKTKTSGKALRLPPGTPNPVDIHVGGRLRQRRTLMGLSQERLGESVGLTFQQIQKYERGANRMGASRLFEFSQILDAPIAYFFEDMPSELKSAKGRYERGLSDQEQEPLSADPLNKRETLELVRAYYAITDEGVRRKVFELAKSLASAYGPEDE